jgi:hypothetical protein
MIAVLRMIAAAAAVGLMAGAALPVAFGYAFLAAVGAS